MSDRSLKFTSPYPGLRPFEREEADLFFGRETQINEMLLRLEDQSKFRFLAVLGASGCGKSSLVRAGLIPALDQGFLLGAPSQWKFVIARPGEAPLQNLANAWVDTWHPPPQTKKQSDIEHHKVDIEFTLAQLRGGPLGIVRAYRGDSATKDCAVLVLVDQFEELFRFRREQDSTGRTVLPRWAGDTAGAAANDIQQAKETEQERQRNESASLVELLLTTARQTDAPIYVVVTMRSEFLGDCDAFIGLPEAISHSQYLTPRMTRAQLSEAITRPLQIPEFHASIEPALVTKILNDVGTDPDQLPLMQHALMRTWTRATDESRGMGTLDLPVSEAGVILQEANESGKNAQPSELRIADYEFVGGVNGALNQHADQIFDALGDDLTTRQRMQRVAQRLFCSLSERRASGPLTRRPISVSQAAQEVGASENDVQAVAGAFQAANLLVFSPLGLPLQSQTRLDISHESLLRQWKVLQQWIEAEARSAQSYRRLIDAVCGGEERLSNSHLAQAQVWLHSAQPNAHWAMRYDGAQTSDESLLPKCRKLIQNSVVARRNAQIRRWLRVGALVGAILIAVAVNWNWKRGTQAQLLVAGIDRKNAIEIGEILPDLLEYQSLSEPLLRNRIVDGQDKPEKWREHLALLGITGNGTSHVRPLVTRLLSHECPWTDFKVICDKLGEHRDKQVTDYLWRIFRSPSQTAAETIRERRSLLPHYRAGILLANWDASSGNWQKEDYALLALRLVQVDPNDAASVRELLKPKRSDLREPLRSIVVDSVPQLAGQVLPDNIDAMWREWATEAIVDYFATDVELLCACACRTNPRRFKRLFDIARNNPSLAVEEFVKIAEDKPPPITLTSEGDQHEKKRVELGKRRAKAAIALMELGENLRAATILEVDDDPEAQSQFIELFRTFGLTGQGIWDTYLQVFRDLDPQDTPSWTLENTSLYDTRYALIICLGKIGNAGFPADQAGRILDHARLLYQWHPSAGVHGAARWLMTQWGAERSELLELDCDIQTSQASAPKREWFVRTDRDITRTFVRFEASNSTYAGTPRTVWRWQDEWSVDPKYDTISTAFAVCTQEVTREEFDGYLGGIKISPGKFGRFFFKESGTKFSPNLDSPMSNVRWFDAVHFCRWLTGDTEQETDQCYEPLVNDGKHLKLKNDNKGVESLDSVEVWNLKSGYERVDGFRLPLEKEWEFACRGGTSTSFGFGNDYLLAKYYAWSGENRDDLIARPGGELIPNLSGLFDMHGNMLEWCDDYSWDMNDRNNSDKKDTSRRILRGGGWQDHSFMCRSGARYKYYPYTSHGGFGFRLVCKPPDQ